MVKDSITLIVNFDSYHPKFDEDVISLFTDYTITETRGFYDRNCDKIQKALNSTNRGRVLDVLFYLHKTNALELSKIIEAPYSLIRQYISKLKRLRLITLKEGISEKGRREIAIKLHSGVKLVPYSEFVDSRDFKEIIKAEKVFAKKAEKEYKKGLERARKNRKY